MTLKNHEEPTEAATGEVQAGQKNFAHYCLVCHGLDRQNYIRHLPPKGSMGEPEVYTK